MAKIDFNTLASNTSTPDWSNNKRSTVGYFTLKKDGEEAIVRFPYNSISEFDTLSIHNITTSDNKNRMVNCLKESGNSPITECPLCAAGVTLSNKFFVKLIQYTQGPNGTVVAEPKIWIRPALKFGRQLGSYLSTYGSIAGMLFKIIRHGTPGNTNTEYDLLPLPINSAVYPDSIYTPTSEDLNEFTALGRMVMNKSAEDLATFVATGSFPMKTTAPNNQTVAPAPTSTVAAQIPNSNVEMPTYVPQGTPTMQHPVAPVMPTPTVATTPFSVEPQPVVAPSVAQVPPTVAQPAATPNAASTTAPQTFPWGTPVNATPSTNSAFERPRRY